MGFVRIAAVVALTAILLNLLPGWLDSPPALKHQGTTAKGWESVAEVFQQVLETNPKFGYAFGVYHKEKKVVDLYGGYARYATRDVYRENTLTTMFSSTKGIGAVCVAMLVDRGLLDYKKPVSHYWPEFAANGKESITVETLLSHQAGLYTLSSGYSLLDQLNNPEELSRKLAEQKPLFKPGTSHGYHGLTIGLYMEELLKRVDPKHRTLDKFFQEELAKPLGLDVLIGLPFSENYRVAESRSTLFSSLEDWNAFFFGGGLKETINVITGQGMVDKMMKGVKEQIAGDAALSPYLRQAPSASFSGYGRAGHLAKLMGILAAGGSYKGKSYLSPKTSRMLTETLTTGPDEVVRAENVQFGRGVSPIQSPLGSWMFGTPGFGGQMVYADLDHQVGIAFLTNKLYSGVEFKIPQFKMLLEAAYKVVKNIT